MTPHNEANKEDIAKTVLMPGDPLRAKFIAETYLEDYKLVNTVRNCYAYTGFYKGKRVTVMASGMGMPSIGIYSYELFKFYDVDTIIRVGSAGAYTDKLNLYDVVLVDGAYSDSSYAKAQNGEERNILHGNDEVNNHIKEVANNMGIPIHFTNIHSSDIFYKENDNFPELYEKYGCAAVEMESFALFHNANVLGKKAACLLTISDSFVSNDILTQEQRETGLSKMIELALDSIITL